MGVMILGFSVDDYKKDFLDGLTSKQKYELYLDDSNAKMYDTVDDFLNELNEDLVDTENNYWYAVNK